MPFPIFLIYYALLLLQALGVQRSGCIVVRNLCARNPEHRPLAIQVITATPASLSKLPLLLLACTIIALCGVRASKSVGALPLLLYVPRLIYMPRIICRSRSCVHPLQADALVLIRAARAAHPYCNDVAYAAIRDIEHVE